MVKVDGKDITMWVGDKIALTIGIKGWSGYSSGDSVYMAIKPSGAGDVMDFNLPVTAADGALSLAWNVSSSVTKNWQVGRYTYELRAQYSDGINRDLLQQGGTLTICQIIK